MLPPNPVVGQIVCDQSTGMFWFYNGTSWVIAMDPSGGSGMWTVATEKDILILLEEFGIEAHVERRAYRPGEIVIVVDPENVRLAAGVVSQMIPPAGTFLRVDQPGIF